MSDVRITTNATTGRLELHTPYHSDFVTKVREIGGRWSRDRQVWSVDPRDEDRARELLINVYGTDGSPEVDADRVTIRIPLYRAEVGDQAWYAGRQIARRRHRDSSVELMGGAILVEGRLSPRGGSMRYPKIDADVDVVVELRDVPRRALEQHEDDEYEIVAEAPTPVAPSVETLLARREELLKQVREIDEALTQLDPEGSAHRREAEDEEAIRLVAEAAERKRADEAKRPLECRCGQHTCKPEGMSPAEYARRVGRSRQTILAHIKRGEVAAVRHAGRWYITESPAH